MKHFYLHSVVFVCGAAVLALEILGTRILGPFYGVSIFLWSALITVTLASLSVGYVLGGAWADRNPSMSRLSALILIAGVWIMLIPWMKHPFLSLGEPLGLRAAVLLTSFILFFVPLTLLGTVAPFAIRLKASGIDAIGRTAGNLYAISTIASVFSALLTGFVLIPSVGVSVLTLLIGGALVVCGAVGILMERRNKGSLIQSAGGLMFIVAVSFSSPIERADPARGLLEVRQSPYAELRVIDMELGRHLIIDGGIHSLVDTVSWMSYLRYAAVMDLPKYYVDKRGDMLLLGIGAGSLMKQYASAGWRVDAVDIDPEIVDVAKTYFNLQASDGTTYVMDARQYLATTAKQYDVILMDAFGSSSIPFHLVTQEVFALIASHIRPGGVFALNIETIGWNDPIIATVGATMNTAFPGIVAFPIEEPPNRLGNIIIMGSDAPLQARREPERNESLDPDWRYGPGYQKAHAFDNQFVPAMKNIRPLTDELNPIDLRAETINLAARMMLHEYFQEAGVSW